MTNTTLPSPAPTRDPAPGAPPATRKRASVRSSRVAGIRKSKTNALFIYAGLALIFLYSVAPVWWLIVSATKDTRDLYNSSGLFFAKLNIAGNLSDLAHYQNGIFFRWMANSLFYSATGAAVCTVVSLAAGYSLSRFEFKGRNLGLAVVVGSFLIPGAMLTLPLFLVFAKLGLVDTAWAVLIPSFISPFSVYLAKVYIDGAVPPEILDAARIDGAGELQIFFRIVVRLMTTGGATIFLLSFVGNWNGFFLPLTMLRGSDKWTVSLGLYAWLQRRVDTSVDITNLVITGSLLSVIPLVVLMISLQRYWRSGLTLGSLK